MFFGSGPIASAPIGSIGLPSIEGNLTQTVLGMSLSAGAVAQRTGDLSITLGAVTAASVAFAGTQGLLSSTLGAWSIVTPTNLLKYSQEFDNAIWGKTDITVTANAIAAPNGTMTADLLTEGTAGTSGLVQNITSVVGTPVIFSLFVKRGNTDWFRLRLFNGTPGINAWFNANTGTAGTVENIGSCTDVATGVVDAGNGWYRVWVRATSPTGTTPSCQFLSAGGDGVYTRATGSLFYVWQGDALNQRELTTPILTTSTSATGPHAVVGIGSVLNVSLGTLTSSGAGGVAIVATLSKALDGLTLTTFGGPIGAVTLNQNLGPVTLTGVSAVAVAAVLTKALGTLTGASTALAGIVGVLTKTMSPLVIQPRINYVPDSSMSGGTSSILPPTWTFQPAAGLTQAIVGKGVEFGYPYVDWSVTGTVGGATVYPALFVMPNNVAPIINGQLSTASVYGRILSGSIPAGAGGVLLLQQVYSAAPGYLNGYSNSGYLDGTFSRLTTTGAPNSVGAAYARSLLAFGNGIPAASVVNLVIRVYAPQMEIGTATASAAILTYGTFAYGSHVGVDVIAVLAKSLDTLTLSGLVGIGIASALAKTISIIQPVNKNLVSHSHLKSGTGMSFAGLGWTDNGLDLTVMDPNGNVGARKVTYTSGNGSVRIKVNSSDFGGTPGVAINGSIYIKTADGSTVNVTTDINDVNQYLVSVGPTWTRISASTIVATNNYRFFDITPSAPSTFHVWGGQITEGSTDLLTYVENVAVPTTMLVGPVVSATLTKTLGALTFSGAGTVGVVATLAKALGAVTLSSGATHPVIGALNKALGAVTSVATVAVRWKKRWVFFVG